jgi:tripartite-type tricarboxylate transporter receptor subunit TctC
MTIRTIGLAGLLTAAILSSGAGMAAPYPERPLQLILPFPAGGAADVIGRVLAKELEPRLGQPVVVINKAGAGTIIAAQAVSVAPPDGYTLFLTSNTTFSINPAIQPNLPYNPATQFEPVAMVAKIALAIVAHPSLPFSDVKSLVAGAKAAPDKYFYASFGNATVSHFAGEMFKGAAGVKLEHVPYKGSSPAMTDLVGGQVPLLFDTVVAALPQLKAGRVKVLAVTTANRSALLPAVPTLAESGYPGFDIGSWVAVVGPAGMPAEVKARLGKEFDAVMDTAEMRERLTGLGFEPAYAKIPNWPQLVTEDIARMKAIATQANIKAE